MPPLLLLLESIAHAFGSGDRPLIMARNLIPQPRPDYECRVVDVGRPCARSPANRLMAVRGNDGHAKNAGSLRPADN
jgi:hypothetical protein